MRTNRLFRPTLIAALAAGGVATSTTIARANIEVGGTAGIHVFSEDSELGVPDTANSPSERNSALFGARIGVFFNDYIGVEGEFGVIPSEARTMVFDIWNITYRAQIVGQFLADKPETKLIPFVLVGAGNIAVVSTNNPEHHRRPGYHPEYPRRRRFEIRPIRASAMWHKRGHRIRSRRRRRNSPCACRR